MAETEPITVTVHVREKFVDWEFEFIGTAEFTRVVGQSPSNYVNNIANALFEAYRKDAENNDRSPKTNTA